MVEQHTHKVRSPPSASPRLRVRTNKSAGFRCRGASGWVNVVKMATTPLRKYENSWDAVTDQVIGAAIEVHRQLGPGLLESAYEECLADELGARRIRFARQVALPVMYRGRPLNHGYRIDFIVDQVILEIKAVEHILPVHRAQLLTYLRLKHLPAGLLLNFHAALLRDGIVRIVNSR